MNQTNPMADDTHRRSGRQPRTAILVLGCLLNVYDRCIRTIRATWGSKPVDRADIYYVYGAHNVHIEPDMVDIDRLIGRAAPTLHEDEAWVSGDIILCGASDVYTGQRDCILRKRLIAFDYLANQRQYDFVYTVCATSYVDVDVLQRYVGSLPATGVYQGPLGVEASCGYPFVSGASMLLSKDIAAALADSAHEIIASNANNHPDDVAIGHWIANHCCIESEMEIRNRIATGVKATGDNPTFVLPHDHGMMNFVESATDSHVPHERAYHYHFHSRRIEEMQAFHRRFFRTST